MFLILLLFGPAVCTPLENYVNTLLKQETPGQNVISSPMGVWSLAHCLARGASGTTATQLQNAFNLRSSDEAMTNQYMMVAGSWYSCPSCANITNHNYVFHDTSVRLNADYEMAISRLAGSVVALPFYQPNLAAQYANSEVMKTQHLYSQPFSPSDFEDSSLIVANVIAFFGAWRHPFDQKVTRKLPFFNDKGYQSGTVNMMYQWDKFRMATIGEINADVLELPYGDTDDFSMLIMLPNKGTTVTNLINDLVWISIASVFQKLENTEDYTYIHIPRFKAESTIKLDDKFKYMGVKDMFGWSADFSRMVNSKVFISKVFQQASIEVTETGTVAQAATKAIAMPVSAQVNPKEFNANRPFVFCIIGKQTNSVLFAGVYSTPSLY